MASHSAPGITGNTNTLSTSAESLVARGNFPKTVILQNIDASINIFVGGNADAALTAANGFRVKAGESFSVDLPPLAELWAIAASGTPEVRFLVLDGNQGF